MVSTTTTGRVDLRLEDGRISEIGPELAALPGDAEVDAAGQLVIPGIVDVHVHLRDPGSPERESFESGTAAAASNGVTTILEMPTADVPVTTAERLVTRGTHLTGRSYIDFGLYGGAGRDSLEDVADCAAAGAIAFKTFTHRPTAARAAAFEGLWSVSAPDLRQTMRAVAATGRIHAMHCEDDSLLEFFAGLDDPTASFGQRHRSARPSVVEQAAVAMATTLARDTRARLHLVHVSTDEAVQIAAAARQMGADLTVETCAHYLLLDDATLELFGSHAKCNPPLRPSDTRKRLVQALRDGRIDLVASDHCSFTPEEVAEHADDPVGALPGLPGIEFLLPSLLRVVEQDGVDLRQMVAAVTSTPARRFGLTGKGDIAVGHDADVVVVDQDAPAGFHHDQDYYARGSRNAVYLEGLELRGRARHTFVRGRPVIEDGKLCGSPDHGRWLRAR